MKISWKRFIFPPANSKKHDLFLHWLDVFLGVAGIVAGLWLAKVFLIVFGLLSFVLIYWSPRKIFEMWLIKKLKPSITAPKS